MGKKPKAAAQQHAVAVDGSPMPLRRFSSAGALYPVAPGRRRGLIGVTKMPRTILIVEDNDMFRGMLGSMIALRGYTVITARRGAEGLAKAAAQPIDAAITDVDMPEMNGFEFCRQLRAQQQAAGREIPVWIMTGVMLPALAKRSAAAGTLLVLRKPFPVDEVCRQFEQEFALPGSAAPAGASPPPGGAAPAA